MAARKRRAAKFLKRQRQLDIIMEAKRRPMIRSREIPGTPTRGKRFTGTPAGRRTLRLGDFFSAKRSAEVSSFFVPHPQNRHPGRGRLRRFHLGKGRESQQRIRTFPKGSA